MLFIVIHVLLFHKSKGFCSEKLVTTKLNAQTIKLKRRVKGSGQDSATVGLSLKEERKKKSSCCLGKTSHSTLC